MLERSTAQPRQKLRGSTKAADIVREVLVACLPPGVPPSFHEVISAEIHGSGRKQKIRATLVMFDEKTARVELSRWAHGWSHRFTDMPGGAASWECSRWVRVEEEDYSA